MIRIEVRIFQNRTLVEQLEVTASVDSVISMDSVIEEITAMLMTWLKSWLRYEGAIISFTKGGV